MRTLLASAQTRGPYSSLIHPPSRATIKPFIGKHAYDHLCHRLPIRSLVGMVIVWSRAETLSSRPTRISAGTLTTHMSLGPCRRGMLEARSTSCRLITRYRLSRSKRVPSRRRFLWSPCWQLWNVLRPPISTREICNWKLATHCRRSNSRSWSRRHKNSGL